MDWGSGDEDRFRFKHRLDKPDADGEIVEHLAGIEELGVDASPIRKTR